MKPTNLHATIKNRRNLLFTIVLAIALAGTACDNSTDSGPPPSPEATFEGLGDLGGGSSYARNVSADGSVVVGYSTNPEDNNEAFRWEDGTMTGLGTLGGEESYANGVSADGSVVVGSSRNPENHFEAFRWEGGTMTGLGTLGGSVSYAFGVSADGSVVVGWSASGSGAEAFIWTAAEGMQSLQAVLENEYNLDLTGWILENARGISDDGTVIVGFGENPNGDTEAWRAFLGEPVAETAASLP